MKLEGKKDLIARTLGVGKNRIILNVARLSEIKEAITKQDIRDLQASGAIHIREIRGRKTIEKRKTRRRHGSVKLRIKNSKRQYITITRKLRTYLAHLKMTDQISPQDFTQLRKEIRASAFRSLAHLKERISQSASFKAQGGTSSGKNTKTKKKRK